MPHIQITTIHAILVGLLLGAAACTSDTKGEEQPPDSMQSRFEKASDGPVQLVTKDGLARTVRAKIGTTGSTPEQRARSFLDAFADAFGLSDASADCPLVQQAAVPGGGGDVVVFGRQAQKRPVFGSEIRVKLDSQGNVEHVSAILPASVEVASEATVESAEAGATAAAHLDALGTAGAQVASSELGLYDPGLVGGASGGASGGVRLAWMVKLDGDHAQLPAVVFVDAGTGEVLLAYDTVDRARQRNVYEVTGAWDQPRTIKESQSQLLFMEGDPPPPQTSPPQLLADYQIYEYAGIVHAFLMDNFGWDSWDGKGAPINIYLRYGARSQWLLDAMFLHPDGASFDSVAHELGHGLTNAALMGPANADAAKLHEPGALKESLSDLLAVFASLSDPTVEGDWLIEDANGQVDRDLKQITYPTVWHYKNYKRLASGADPWEPGNDKGYVHHNSTIASMAAYRLVEGGAHHTESGAPPVIGIGLEKTMQIYHHAIRVYLQHSGTFEDARYALLRACEDLAHRESQHFNIEIRDCGSLLNAWAAVGIGERDEDRDTWSDSIDNCPKVFNYEQYDTNGDKVGDACSGEDTPDAGPVDTGPADTGPPDWVVPGLPEGYEIVSWINFDGTNGTPQYADPNLADISITGDPDTPTFSWQTSKTINKFKVSDRNNVFVDFCIDSEKNPDTGEYYTIPSPVTFGELSVPHTKICSGLSAPHPIIEVGYTYHVNVKVALETKAADLAFIRTR